MSQGENWLPEQLPSDALELPNDGSGFEMCAEIRVFLMKHISFFLS